MKSLSRATALKFAAVLSIIEAVGSILISLPLIARGASGVTSSADSPPYIVLMMSLLLSVIAIVAAYGAWNQQRWGVILTILVNLVNGLSAVPGILFAPVPGYRASAIGTVIVTILIIVFSLWRERKPVGA